VPHPSLRPFDRLRTGEDQGKLSSEFNLKTSKPYDLITSYLIFSERSEVFFMRQHILYMMYGVLHEAHHTSYHFDLS
ncbi:MAG: hypothetical protein Q4A15_03760, partial [Prevotellaceae bacterium]|nr:hypothetical protein [Prevotellaceae bacterium]